MTKEEREKICKDIVLKYAEKNTGYISYQEFGHIILFKEYDSKEQPFIDCKFNDWLDVLRRGFLYRIAHPESGPDIFDELTEEEKEFLAKETKRDDLLTELNTRSHREKNDTELKKILNDAYNYIRNETNIPDSKEL